MLKHPGLLTQTLVDSWVEDLKTDGVNDGHGGRLPLCPHDRTNMDWSCDAVVKSCFPSLAKEVKKELTFQQCNGPQALLAIYHLVYRRNDAKVESILKRLEKQNIRSYPG